MMLNTTLSIRIHTKTVTNVSLKKETE